jgi:hypothetical protein
MLTGLRPGGRATERQATQYIGQHETEQLALVGHHPFALDAPVVRLLDSRSKRASKHLNTSSQVQAWGKRIAVILP